MSQPGRDHVHGHARAQGRRVDVPQIVQPRDRDWPAAFRRDCRKLYLLTRMSMSRDTVSG
jgi:hypothetical protein